MVLRLLTVGDGDLSFSLAMKRAYPQHVDITASTLVESSNELSRTYSNAAENEAELQTTWNVPILYQTDATRLDQSIAPHFSPKFDVILFNHPHLGDSTLAISEKLHAERHYILLCHYFHSAKKYLTERGRIHVCLCGSQATTWNLHEAAQRNQLKLVCQEGTESPVGKWLFPSDIAKDDDDDVAAVVAAAHVQRHYPCPRRYRNGKLGSKHFLGKYGYRHRRTNGDLFRGHEHDMIVDQSVNYLFECDNTSWTNDDGQTTGENRLVQKSDSFVCEICGMVWEDKLSLERHLASPAVPDLVKEDVIGVKDDPRLERCLTSESHVEHSKSLIAIPDCPTTPLDKSLILVEATVDKKFDSTRIKWLCRQKEFSFSNYITSKKQCMDAISKGRIYVNGAVALDSGRIVKEKDVVTLVQVSARSMQIGTAGEDALGCRIVEEIPLQTNHGMSHLVVVYKPVGVRVVGSFASNTLEMIAKRLVATASQIDLQEVVCPPLSKLDTGCAGLCVLRMESVKDDGDEPFVLARNIQITYKFTALVHGVVPDDWQNGVYVEVPKTCQRQWKRQKTEVNQTDQEPNESIDSNDAVEDIRTCKHALDLDASIFITCQNGCSSYVDDNDITAVTTVEISSRHACGKMANTISFILRKLGYPVVNDRFCKRELSSLPRRMRNILKQKICIGCYSVVVDVDGVVQKQVTIEPHKRTQSSFWCQVLSDS